MRRGAIEEQRVNGSNVTSRMSYRDLIVVGDSFKTSRESYRKRIRK